MIDALTSVFGDRASWTEPRGGFFTWLRLPDGVESVALAGRAMEARTAVVAGVPFFSDGGGHGHVRLSYSRVADDEIAEGIARLGRAVEALG